MDGTRFDALTKALAGGSSRRRVLKGLGGVLAGALGLGAAAVEAAPPSGAGPCKRPNTKCGKGKAAICTNLSSDSGNCGACGNVCTGGTTCVNSACACPTGQTSCSGTCTDTSSDNNCGACGTVCPAGTSCVSRQCTCPSGQTLCGNGCVDTTSDPNNCGGCGFVCPSGAACVSSVCQTQTPPTCSTDSICESPCQNTSNPNCVCGTTFDGGNPVCYLDQNGCAGHPCSTNTDCADIGPTSTCILGFCTANLCTTDADCGSGSACVNLNGGCGGCDNFTGGTQGICNPVCTS